jgi:hypothetical protein
MILAAALALSSVACMAPVQGGSTTGSSSSKGAETTATGTEGATCDAACAHYLECKGAETADNQSQCVAQCNQLGVTQEQLASFVQSDCATAIATIENANNNSTTNDNGGNGGSTGSQCNGCVWDGSACMWYSQSDWGQGAYSGAASSCDASCCPGH